MSGHLGDLSAEQQRALDEFKLIGKSLLTKDYHDDAFCLRWLRARNFHVDNAKQMLEKSLDFRRRWRIDYLLDEFQPNKAIRQVYIGGTCGFDKQGGCVMLYPLGNMQPKYFLELTRRTNIIKVLLHRMEEASQLLRQQSKKMERNVEAHTIIFDLEGFDVRSNLSTTAISIFCELVGTYESNYPENLSHAFVINAPPIFNLFFNILKPMLNGTTLSKVKIFGKDSAKWKTSLLEVIDADQLPISYGGMKRGSLGDDRCSDLVVYVEKLDLEMIKHLAKELPEHDRVIKINVGRRSTHDHTIDVTEPNSALKVEFESSDHDVGFALLKRTSNGSSLKEILPNKRYNSHMGAVVVGVQCTTSGEYVLRFDNTFSSLRSKSVTMNVAVIPAAQVNEKMLFIHEP